MRNPLSQKVIGIQPSGIRKFFDIAEKMNNVISLGVGEPDFATPWHIRQAGIQSLEDKKTRNYKYLFIQYLARTYFDLGDYENLKATCERFESELSKIKNLSCL